MWVIYFGVTKLILTIVADIVLLATFLKKVPQNKRSAVSLKNRCKGSNFQESVLNQAVKRNIERFPEDFMFQLTKDEFENLRSQFVTAKFSMTRTTPFVFTEHGILMLSSVLRSKIAIDVNIQIMRTFTALRKYALTHDELVKKIEELEDRVKHGEQVEVLNFNFLASFLFLPRSRLPNGSKHWI